MLAVSRRRHSRKQPLKPLFDGHKARCPRCREEMDLLELEILPEIPVYTGETVPVLRCPYCRWLFSLRGGDELRRTS